MQKITTKDSRIIFMVICAVYALVSIPSTLAAPESAPLASAEKSFAERSNERSIEDPDRSEPHVGALGGVSGLPNNQAGALFGVDVGFQFKLPVSFGVSFGVAGAGMDQSRSTLLGKVAYNFAGNIPIIKYSYAGLDFGWIHDSLRLAGNTAATQDYFGVGPAIGFDQPLSRHLTVGAEGKYLFNFERNTANNLAVMAAVKYWL